MSHIFIEARTPAFARVPARLWLKPGLEPALILGMDFIKDGGITIDPIRDRAHVAACSLDINISTVAPRLPPRVYSTAQMLIPAGASARIPCAAAHPCPAPFLRLTNKPALAAVPEELGPAPAVVSVANVSAEPVTIQAGACLGTLEPSDPATFEVQHLSPRFSLLDDVVGGEHGIVAPPEGSHNLQEPGGDDFPYAAVPPPEPGGSEAVDINTQLSREQQESLRTVIERYGSLWEERLGLLNTGESMSLPAPIIDADPTSCPKPRLYKLSASDQSEVDKVFDQLAEDGRIGPLPDGSPCGWPVFVVRREGKARPVMDLRRLNALVTPDVYPLPNQERLREKLKGKRYLTRLDAVKCFYQMPIREEDRWKAAILTHRGLEAMKVSIMGQNRSVAFVQRTLEKYLRHCRDFCSPYVDDIFIYSDTFDEHLSHLDVVLRAIHGIGLTLSAGKCRVAYESMEVLGHTADGTATWAQDSKVRTIQDLEYPRTVKDLEHLVGFFSYYRAYVSHFAALAGPLERLKTVLLAAAPKGGASRKAFANRTPLPHDADAALALEELKSIMTSGLRLAHPDYSRPFLVYTDASREYGFALAVHQTDPATGEEVPITFDSRRLKPAEQRYYPTELEAACAAWAANQARRYFDNYVALNGETLKHKLYTDHSAVTALMKPENLEGATARARNGRLLRCALILSEYADRVEIVHRPGRFLVHVDALSRIYREPSPPAVAADVQVAVVVSAVRSDAEREALLKAQGKDRHFGPVLRLLQSKAERNLPYVSSGWGLDKDEILHAVDSLGFWRVCIAGETLKEHLRRAHDECGHPGVAATYATVARTAHARALHRMVKEYVQHCPRCQQDRTSRQRPYGELTPIETPPHPFHTVTADFIMKLPSSSSPAGPVDTILTVTDKFSKRVYLVAGREAMTAKEWAFLWYFQLYNRIGVPQRIISDRDVRFVSNFWTSLHALLGCELAFSTPYHPQSDRQSERTNQTVEMVLRSLCNEHADDWHWHLPLVELVLANRVSAATQEPPSIVLHGSLLRDPIRCPTAIDPPEQDPVAEAIITRRDGACRDIEAAIARAQLFEKERHGKFRRIPPDLSPGDLVYLQISRGGYGPRHAESIPSRKLGPQRLGPYKIVEKVSKLAYRLELPPGSRMHDVVSIEYLVPAPAGPDPFGRPQPQPMPATDERVIRKILSQRVKDGQLQYLVCWGDSGAHAGGDEWLSEEETDRHGADALQEWLQRQLDAQAMMLLPNAGAFS